MGRLSPPHQPVLLLSAVARRTEYAGRQWFTITPQHGKANQTKAMLASTHVRYLTNSSAAEQFNPHGIGQLMCEYIVATVAPMCAEDSACSPGSSVRRAVERPRTGHRELAMASTGVELAASAIRTTLGLLTHCSAG
jgi:hypothetical protein